MERLKKARTPIRTSFTRTVNSLNENLQSANPEKDTLQKLLEKLERLCKSLMTVDEQVLEFMLDNDCTEEEYAEEHKAIEEYQDKLSAIRYDVNIFIINRDGQGDCVQAEAASVHGAKKKLHLPKLEFHKFGGEVKDWLGFWGQFKKIHEDHEIVPEDKFQYLIQAMVKDSRARELVDSFPPTKENYPKVIESLKDRFGREDILVEVYVRELLKLVIQNAAKQNEKGSLSTLYDRLESHLRSLESIGVTNEKCSSMLFPLVESCLPEDIMRAWQRSALYAMQGTTTENTVNNSKSRLTVLMTFLRTEVEGEERILLAKAGFGQASQVQGKFKRFEKQDKVATAAGLVSTEKEPWKSSCIFCEKTHDGKDCFQAQRMTLQDNKSIISKKKCCFTCLKMGHVSKMCKSNIRCPICGRKHLVILCPDLPFHKESTVSKPGSEKTDVSLSNSIQSQEVVLQTLIVTLQGDGKSRKVRVIIDTGSQRSYILKRTAEDMGYLPIGEEKVIHLLFGGVASEQQTHRSYKIHLSSVNGEFCCNFTAMDQDAICQDIPRLRSGKVLQELKGQGIWLTDVGTGCPRIEVLIGADIAGKLLTGQVQPLQSGLVAVETRLGWTVMGKTASRQVEGDSALTVSSMFVQQGTIEDLWSLDVIGIKDTVENKSKEEVELAVKEHFLETVKQDNEGRYEVSLPWIQGHPTLPSNRSIAEKRLMNATKKLDDLNRTSQYNAVFEDWLSQGIIEEVSEGENRENEHYLPHRAVINDQSLTTPVRPVFDASAHEKNASSLNDCLEKGPNLLELIPSVMTKFREKKIGVSADIKKAFLQIGLKEEDRDFLRFLWWEDYSAKKMKIFRHRRVVFGVNCSPYLLAAVIEYHLKRAPSELQESAEKLWKSFYVDNCLTSVDSQMEQKEFIQDAKKLMASACFDLRGWESTSDATSDENVKPTSVLGMLWNKHNDTLECNVSAVNSESEKIVTKREMLSSAHKVFDPIGFSCPVTLVPKLLLQEAWQLKIGWDSELPEDIAVRYLRWKGELGKLSQVKIPRWLAGESERKDWSLHLFCDASKFAYAAVIFLRAETRDEVRIQLIQARTRVAPLKKISIPRMELLACCIGSRLAESVKKMLDLENARIYYWTDSTTALSWIQRMEKWSVFVFNRVQEIRLLSNSNDWRHVPGEMNPADLPSRGCTVKQLLESKWWEGPAWLKSQEENWPSSNMEADESEINKEKGKMVVSTLINLEDGPRWYMKYYNKYSQIVRMVAWMLRFVYNSKNQREKIRGELKVKEIEEAEKRILKIVQAEVFTDAQKDVHPFSCFRDEQGLIRLKTKIVLRNDYENFRCPVVLPSSHPLISALIQEVHLKMCHAGVQVLLSSLREKYWILKGRKSIKKELTRCLQCKRHESKPLETVPVYLPEDRVRDAAVFEVVGVDLAGPVFLKGGTKAWIVLFTCAIYRAIHLELITSLSTEAFLQSFRRFISRRGRPVTVYSDNGTNFVGANNALSNVDWNAIKDVASSERIQWKFNPPTAAWWGGWWERLIRTIKQLLRRVLGRASLDYEEMVTILCDCESVVNSRPLTYVSEDIDELVPLTPAMFLQEVSEIGVPDLDFVDSSSLNRRLKYRQKLKDDLRKRFRIEYLGHLIQVSDSKKSSKPLHVGDIVLVGSDQTKRMDWQLAKVTKLYPGKDGHVRVVKLKTSSGELTRPIQKVYPLEISTEEKNKIACEESIRVHKVGKDILISKKQVFTRSGRKVKSPEKFSL